MRSLIRKYVLPLILTVIAFGIFFMYTDPAYSHVQEIQQENAEYDSALEKAQELISLRDKLISTYNSFETQDIERLRRMVPGNVDNVRLIIELDRIASMHGMQLGGIEFSPAQEEEEDTPRDYRTTRIQFNLSAPYGNFLLFIRDLERNLRIVDVQEVGFEPGEGGVPEYNVIVETYSMNSS